MGAVQIKYKRAKAASKPVGEEIQNGKDFFDEVINDWQNWGP